MICSQMIFPFTAKTLSHCLQTSTWAFTSCSPTSGVSQTNLWATTFLWAPARFTWHFSCTVFVKCAFRGYVIHRRSCVCHVSVAPLYMGHFDLTFFVLVLMELSCFFGFEHTRESRLGDNKRRSGSRPLHSHYKRAPKAVGVGGLCPPQLTSQAVILISGAGAKACHKKLKKA